MKVDGTKKDIQQDNEQGPLAFIVNRVDGRYIGFEYKEKMEFMIGTLGEYTLILREDKWAPFFAGPTVSISRFLFMRFLLNFNRTRSGFYVRASDFPRATKLTYLLHSLLTCVFFSIAIFVY